MEQLLCSLNFHVLDERTSNVHVKLRRSIKLIAMFTFTFECIMLAFQRWNEKQMSSSSKRELFRWKSAPHGLF